MQVCLFSEPAEAVSLLRSDLAGLESSESEQREPVLMAFARHRFARTFAFALGTLAAHEAPVVQEKA